MNSGVSQGGEEVGEGAVDAEGVWEIELFVTLRASRVMVTSAAASAAVAAFP